MKHREGVAWSPETSTDAFFVTLNKDERKHSATTMYRDYALSEDLFHWESQDSTSTTSPVGRRYLNRRLTVRRSFSSLGNARMMNQA